MTRLDLSLYLVTDTRQATDAGHDLIDLTVAAARGGVTAVQVREKDAAAAGFLDTVVRLAEALPDEVALLVNDRVDVYLAARRAFPRGFADRAHGVHVGQSDLPAPVVRELIGADAVLGLSAATPAQLAEAASSPARIDYVGIGALHVTQTKKDAPAPLGHARFAELAASVAVPSVAIGGVTVADLPRLRAAGAAGAAVVSAVCAAADPASAARDLRRAWEVGE
ncbi:thiamine phosphate synthase [Microbacterium aurantiacum]|uniref:thiamine phosphate synthase n=1 Tax=Microbacterium aurantiacum TaxID=162393 RepID=UPI003D752952